eukprot:g1459.t1
MQELCPRVERQSVGHASQDSIPIARRMTVTSAQEDSLQRVKETIDAYHALPGTKNVTVDSVTWIRPRATLKVHWTEKSAVHNTSVRYHVNSQNAPLIPSDAVIDGQSAVIKGLRFGLKYYVVISGNGVNSVPSDPVTISCPNFACCGTDESDRSDRCGFNLTEGVLQAELAAQKYAYHVGEVSFAPCFHPEACLGGIRSACTEGYTGMMCHRCETHFARRGEHECGPCDGWSTLYTVLAILVFIAICVYFIKSTLSNSEKTLEIEMAKIAMSGTQALTVLGRYPLKWPRAVLDVFNIAGGLFSGADDVISFKCAMDNAGGSRYFRGSAVILTAPLVVIAGAGAFWAFKAQNDNSTKKNIRSNFVVSVMVILFMVLPTLNQTAFQLLTCRAVGTEFRVAGDFDIECFGSTHVSYILGVATPALLLYSIGVPMAAISLLRRLHRSDKLFEPREKSYSASVYAFLYGGYKRDRYYWEVVIMVRKVLLNLILVVMASAPPLAQGLVVLMTLLAFKNAHSVYQPYSNDILNRIESLSLMLAVSVLLLGFFLFEDGMPNTFQMAITVIMVGLILISLLAFIAVLFMRVKQSRANAIKQGLTKASEKAHDKLESGFELAMQRLRAPSQTHRSSSEENFEMANPMA